MGSPNSSISSSDWARYLKAFGAVTLAGLALAAAVSIAGIRAGKVDFTYYDVFLMQKQKLAAARVDRDVATVFVGDSSLGHAIDTATWRQLSGGKALNLALTGAYGFEGSLGMIRLALEHVRPKKIVIMQALDVFTRPIAYEGLLYTTPELFPFPDVPFETVANAYLNLDFVLAVIRRWRPTLAPPAATAAAPDYIAQGEPLPNSRRFRAYTEAELAMHAARINPAKLLYLGKIRRLCDERKVECVFAHGTIYDAYCRSSGAYIDAATRLVEMQGLRVAAGPLCVPAAELGDSLNHVSPEKKAHYTARYFALIEGARK